MTPRRSILGMSVLAVLLGTGAGSSAQDAGARADVQRGRGLALSLCASCHVVAADAPTQLIVQPPAPSFEVIANRPGASEESLRKVLGGVHKNVMNSTYMKSLLLPDRDAIAITHYILSLKKQP